MPERLNGFTGTFRYSVDAKNRISIPSKLRKEVPVEAENWFVILSDQEDRCIKIYPRNVFKNITDAINKSNPFHPLNVYIRRRLLSNVYDEKMDNQNRIKLPPELLKKTNINGECLVIGVGDYIEIWNPEEFEKYMQESVSQFQGNFGELLASVMNDNK